MKPDRGCVGIHWGLNKHITGHSAKYFIKFQIIISKEMKISRGTIFFINYFLERLVITDQMIGV